MNCYESTRIWKEIFKPEGISRPDLIRYVKAAAEDAKAIGIDKLAVKSGKPTPRPFPDTVGEALANSINYALVYQYWINDETAPDLEEISEIAGSLEMRTDDRQLWQKLLQKIDELKG